MHGRLIPGLAWSDLVSQRVDHRISAATMGSQRTVVDVDDPLDDERRGYTPYLLHAQARGRWGSEEFEFNGLRSILGRVRVSNVVRPLARTRRLGLCGPAAGVHRSRFIHIVLLYLEGV